MTGGRSHETLHPFSKLRDQPKESSRPENRFYVKFSRVFFFKMADVLLVVCYLKSYEMAKLQNANL